MTNPSNTKPLKTTRAQPPKPTSHLVSGREINGHCFVDQILCTQTILSFCTGMSIRVDAGGDQAVQLGKSKRSKLPESSVTTWTFVMARCGASIVDGPFRRRKAQVCAISPQNLTKGGRRIVLRQTLFRGLLRHCSPPTCFYYPPRNYLHHLHMHPRHPDLRKSPPGSVNLTSRR